MKFIATILFLILIISNLQAQHGAVEGLIIDEQNHTLVGATIVLNKGKYSTASNEEGKFEMNKLQSGNYLLEVFFVGYETYKRQIMVNNNRQNLTITLKTTQICLDEFAVIGNQIEKMKRENSLSIEVVNQRYLQQHIGGSLMESLERLPGVSTIEIGSGQSKPVIRGLSFNRVVVVENGIKHEGQQWGADHGLEIDQYAAEQIEVIKGPVSLSYGSDAIGGIIDISSSPVPQKDGIGGKIDFNAKSNNKALSSSLNLYGRRKDLFIDSRFTWIDYADIRVPVDSVTIYSYQIPLHNKQLRNTAGQEYAFHFNTGIMKSKFSSIFYSSLIKSQSGFFANAHGVEPRMVDAPLQDASDRDLQMPYQESQHLKIINRSLFDWGKHRTKVDIGFQNNDRHEWSQYVDHGYMPPIYPTNLAIPSTLELRFNKNIGSINVKEHFHWGSHVFNLGINSELQDNKVGGWGFLIPAFRQFNAGIFAYDKIKINEKLLLHAGLRYDYGQIWIQEQYDWFSSTKIIDQDTISEPLKRSSALNRHFENYSWGLGLNYNYKNFSLKTNIGKSFRMPIAMELAVNGVNYHHFSYEKGDSSLSAESSYQLDLSLEWNLSKWVVQISPFVNYFPNYIYLNPTSDFDFYYGAGNQIYQYTQSSVFRYGGEFHAHYLFGKSLKLGIIAEYIYSIQLTGEKKGFTLPFSPQPSVLLNGTYSPKKIKKLIEPYFSVDLQYNASQKNIVPPEKATPASMLVNLAVGSRIIWKQQEIQISLQIKNLANTPYLNHTSYYRQIDLVEAGRNFILALSVPFNLTK